MTRKFPWLQKTKLSLIIVGSIVFIGVIVLIFAGYWFNWTWTGFKGYISPPLAQGQHDKTLWDWMQLLIIPVVLAVGGLLFNRVRDQTDRAIATDSQRETVLKEFLDYMSEQLRNMQPSAPESNTKPEHTVKDIVRARTSAALGRLDGVRKGVLFQFLYESDLLQKETGNGFINLSGADLSGADLSGVNLREINLSKANLSGTNLSEVDFLGADLSRADLREADLREANLRRANLYRADLRGAKLIRMKVTEEMGAIGIVLTSANLEHSNLRGANLYSTNLLGINLQGADLRGANLSRTKLCRANLRETDLGRANLFKADLSRAETIKIDKVFGFKESGSVEMSMEGADLSDANLEGANLSYANLNGACLRRITMSGSDLGEDDLYNANLHKGVLTSYAIVIFPKLSLYKAKLQEAILWKADLRRANLQKADLYRADLGMANLSHADLRRTVLSQTDLRWTILNEANLQGANLQGAKGSLEPLNIVTMAIKFALAIGADGHAAESSLIDAYKALKALLEKKYGNESEVIKAINVFELKPSSSARRALLHEQIISAKADQDPDILQAAQDTLELVKRA